VSQGGTRAFVKHFGVRGFRRNQNEEDFVSWRVCGVGVVVATSGECSGLSPRGESMKKYSLIFGLVVLLLAACSQQQSTETLEAQVTNYWKKLGDVLDIVPKNNTANAKLLIDRNGKPVVVWAEDNGLWYLQGKRWNGVAWEKLAFPTRPLAYDNGGVTPFDVVIDSSNALVVTQPGKILRATTTWIQLGSEGTRQLQTDKYGRVHALFYNAANDNSFIKRWDGKAWQAVASFRKLITETAFGDFYIVADSFLLKPDGKPVVASSYRTCFKCANTTVFDWNGQTWNGVAGVTGACCDSAVFDYASTSDNQVMVALADTLIFPYIRGAGITAGLGKADFFSLAVKNNFPVAMYRSLFDNPDAGRIFVDVWTGSKFVHLGGDIRRNTTNVFLEGDVVVDKNGTIFALSREAACFASASCGGANIYLSQYIP
jgi:hypothetical protein